MNVRKTFDAAKTALGVAAVVAVFAGSGFEVCRGIVEAVVHRNEPTYLISRAYDPTWREAGFVPASLMCYSPARCEPNGKPSPQYFVLLKEYEVRRWGLDPAQEIPVTRDPYL